MRSDAKKRADESVATRFSRAMNAATSPYGFLTDYAVAAALAALPIVLVVRQASSGALGSPVTVVLVVVAVAPILIAVVLSATLRGAREQVVDWLAGLPFEVDNVNSLLVGLTDEVEITIEGEAPDRRELQPLLDKIHDDALVTSSEGSTIVVKIGVVESKLLPLRSHHQRWVRFRRVVEEFMVPLSKRLKVVGVRVS